MADSDEEFARFLEQDDDSSSASSTSKKKGSKSSSKKSSAAKAKRSSNSKNKSKSSKYNKAAKATSSHRSSSKPRDTSDSDSDEPPPSYSSTRGMGADADPYAFELDTSYNLEEEEEIEKPKKPKKKEPPPKKEPRSVLSLEERMAQILKRTGSSAFESFAATAAQKEEEDEEEKDAEEDMAKEVKQEKDQPTESQRGDSDHGSDSRLSLSDSLGMESADFEVGVHAKRKFESRLSLSSLQSEKFAVNTEALEESELHTQSRYDHVGDNMLDQTTEHLAAEPASHKSEDYSVDSDQVKDDDDNQFVSVFENMKDLFSIDTATEVDKSTHHAESNEREVEERPAEVALTKSVETFGYDDEDFDADEDSPDSVQHETANVASIDQSVVSSESLGKASSFNQNACDKDQFDVTHEEPDATDEYHDDGFEDEGETLSHAPAKNDSGDSDVPPPPPPSNPGAPTSTVSVLVADGTVETSRFEREIPKKEDVLQRVDAQPTLSLRIDVSSDQGVQPPPMSPPPPPPPDDDEDQEPQHRVEPMTLNGSENNATAERNARHSTVSHNSTPASRFQQLEGHVATLRFVSTRAITDPQALSTTAPKAQPVDCHRKRESASDMAAEDRPHPVPDSAMLQRMDEMDEFLARLRDKGDIKKRGSVQSVRSSISRENDLFLHLQRSQRQAQEMQQHIQVLEGDDFPAESASIAAEEEIRALRQEIKTQDTLIQGFQRENEHLMSRLKVLQKQMQFDVYVENANLKEEARELRERVLTLEQRIVLDGKSEPRSLQFKAAVEARLQAEAHALALQDQLEEARRNHRERENELQLELQKIKKAKVDMECKFAGIDLKQVEEEINHTRELKAELEYNKKNYEHALAGLQKKVDWYVENQRFVDEQDDEIRKMKVTINELSQDVENCKRLHQATAKQPTARSPGTSRSSAHVRSAADIRRIQELEQRLADMEEAMRKRHPDSLVNLILASRKADEQSKIQVMEAEHQERVRALEEEIESIQLANEKKLIAFRQQQERLLKQYQKRAEIHERSMEKTTSRPESRQTPHQRAQKFNEGEKDAERIRRFYVEKIKEVERKWEAKYRSLRKSQGRSASTGANGDLSYAQASVLIDNLQQALRQKDAELKRLQAERVSVPVEDRDEQAVEDQDTAAHQNRIKDLEQQLESSESAREQLVQTLMTIQQANTSATPTAQCLNIPSRTPDYDRKEIENELREWFSAMLQEKTNQHNAELQAMKERLEAMEQAAKDASIAHANAQQELVRSVGDMKQLHDQILQIEREKAALNELAARVPSLESEIMQLKEEASIPRTPSMLQYHSLQLKIDALSQKYYRREEELRELLAQATKSSELEKLQMRRVHEVAIAAKNEEIRKFKRQLDEFLAELAALRA